MGNKASKAGTGKPSYAQENTDDRKDLKNQPAPLKIDLSGLEAKINAIKEQNLKAMQASFPAIERANEITIHNIEARLQASFKANVTGKPVTYLRLNDISTDEKGVEVFDLETIAVEPTQPQVKTTDGSQAHEFKPDNPLFTNFEKPTPDMKQALSLLRKLYANKASGLNYRGTEQVNEMPKKMKEHLNKPKSKLRK